MRDGAQQPSRATVALGGVEMYGVAACGAQVAVVDGADMLRGVAVTAVAAGDIGGMQVGVVDAAGAALRREGIEGVDGRRRRAVADGCAAVGHQEDVVGQGRESVDAEGRAGSLHGQRAVAIDGAVADAHRRRACLQPLKGHVVGLHLGHADVVGCAGGHL